MATKAHKNLTGSDLHEPKGIETANAGDVYQANGAGSGGWAQMPFKGSFVHIREETNPGSNSVTSLTSGAWVTRALNTFKVNNLSSTVSVGVLQLPAGTYTVMAAASFVNTQDMASATSPRHKLRLRNITDGATLISGMSAYQSYFNADVGGGQKNFQPPSGGTVELNGQFTLAAAKAVALQHYCVSTNGVSGGVAVSSGEIEVYADLLLWKIA